MNRMTVSKRTGLILSLLIATTCCTLDCGDKPERLDLSAEQWREDLKYLARTLPARHANVYHFTPKERFHAAVADLDGQIEHLNSDAVWTGIGKIVALVGDAHTYLQAPRDSASFPIGFAKFGNTHRVVSASQELSRLLGARVVKVGDTPVEHVSELLFQMLAQDENPPLAEAFIEDGLTTGAKLHGLGIIPDRNRTQYTLVADDGKEFTVQVHAQPTGQPDSALIQASKEQPLSRQRRGESFWCTYLMNSKTVYCNVRLIRGLKNPGRQMLELIEQSKPEKLVIDLRQNPGGDYHEGLKYLVHPVREIPSINTKGHLFVLVGANTFSAAMSNATHFRYQTEAILVGGTIGEKPNSYQESNSFTLPNSHLTVHYSSEFYKFVETDENVVKPDKEIEITWEDYLAGRDPALEWALNYGGGNSNGNKAK
jgi:hypothetical protein